jgi:SHS family lactate transporter-like MFS transporter
MAKEESGKKQPSAEQQKEEFKVTKKDLALIAVLVYLGWGLLNTDGNLVLVLSDLITKSLNMTIQQYSYVVSAGFFASFVLGLILGPLGDRLGRKFVLQLTLIGTAFLSMLQYGMQNFIQWLLIRIGAGGFAGAEWGAGGTLLNEVAGKRIRGLLLSIMQSGWVFGYGLASAIALLTVGAFGPSYGWRVAFLFAFLPALLVLILRAVRMRESPRFEHLKAIREAKKRGDYETVNRLLQIYKVDLEKAEKHPYKQLFNKDILRVTVALTFFNFITTGIALTTNAFQEIYFTAVKGFSFSEVTLMFSVVAFAGIIGYIANGILSDYIGAKWSIIIFAALETLGIYLLTFFVSAPNLVALWAFYILFFFTENGQFAAIIRANTEAFPTRIRATGAIWCGAFWSLGQAAWPLLFAQLIPALTFNGAWLWAEVVPEIIALVIFAVIMPNIPPRRELEEIAY